MRAAQLIARLPVAVVVVVLAGLSGACAARVNAPEPTTMLGRSHAESDTDQPAATPSAAGSDSSSASGPVTSAATTGGLAPFRAPAASSPPAPAVPVSPTAPVIVIDPGHAPTITSTDPATGLNDSDYENEPEMQDVFAVALLVKAKLTSDGYQVVMTKNNVNDRISLGQRAAVANNAHAALALSIHDQAGASGGIGFTQGNNIVYYQAVGDYRETPAGAKVTFTDGTVAATSQKCGQQFQTARAAAQGATIHLQGNVGYDLGSRGLAPGNIWIVQLLSKVPWIYNEAGGNSSGQSGLNATDKQKYADGLVAGVLACVPLTR